MDGPTQQLTSRKTWNFKHSSQFFKCIKNNLVNAELKDIKQGSSVDRVWCTSITVSVSWSDSPFQKFVHKSNGKFHLSVFTHSKCVCEATSMNTKRGGLNQN